MGRAPCRRGRADDGRSPSGDALWGVGSRRGVLAAGLVVVVAVIAAGIVALGRDEGPRPPPAAIGGSLPSSACSDVVSGGAKPDVLIASDLPLLEAGRQELVDVIGGVLENHDFRAGRFVVGYQSCDDSVARGSLTSSVCAHRTRARTPTRRTSSP